MIKINFDKTKKVETPTIILCNRNDHKLGSLFPIEEYEITPDLYEVNEFSFKISKTASEQINNLWDKIIDYKIIYIPEYDEYFEIEVSVDETDDTIKTVTGKNRGVAELSHTILYDIEINTEEDISRTDYQLARIYNEDDVKNSLLARVLSKAPHYFIEHVDSSLCDLVRSFSVDNTSIYDFLTGDLAKEINCLTKVNSKTRSISLYDLEDYCQDCGYRHNDIDVCPKCGSKNIKKGYGENTTVFISRDNLASEITLDTNKDNVKNTFKISGGDDIITAAVATCNPNGTNYINHYSDEMLDDMSKELREKLKSYDILYNSKLDLYKEAMFNIYNSIDEILNLTSKMMPSVETSENTASTELSKLTASNLGKISVQDVSKAGKTEVNNAVKSIAAIYMDSGFDVDIYSSTYANQKWSGKFKVTTNDDEEDVAINDEDIVLTIDDDYENFIRQKIKKCLDKEGMSDEEIYDWTLYSLNRLSSFSDAYQSCLDILIEMGIGEESNEFYSSIYKEYYNKKLSVDAEMKKREDEITEQEKIKSDNEKIRDSIQRELNLENYIGEDLWKEYCAYRLEDKYENENYISDGLDNAEIFKKAEELFEVANKEIYKASQTQYTLSATIGNLLSMDEFIPLKNKFKLGNWIRIQIDNKIYKLRLIKYTIKLDDIKNLPVEFSNVERIIDGITDLQSIINSAQSMASSYESIVNQAKHSEETTNMVNKWIDKGLDATNVAIKNSTDQNVIYDKHGILCRQYNDITEEYDDEQLKIVNNTLAITDDDWEHIKTAIGKIYYVNPENPDELKSAYGLIGETIVGKLLLGENLGVYNESNSMKFTKDGLEITNGEYTFIVDPNKKKLISIYNKNTGRNILYVDNDNQLCIGDGSNYIKYHKKDDGTYGLDISANSFSFSNSDISIDEEISNIKDEINTVKDEVTTNLRIESSRGTVFKNDSISTILSAVIYRGSQRITDIDTLKSIMGSNAYLQWSWQRLNDDMYGIISADDSKISNGGFTLTINPKDVDTKVTFMCELMS